MGDTHILRSRFKNLCFYENRYEIYTFYKNRYKICIFYENFVPIFVKSADFVPIFVKSVILSMVDELTISEISLFMSFEIFLP